MDIQKLISELENYRSQYEQVATQRPITLETLAKGESLRVQIVALERQLRQKQSLPFVDPLEGWTMKWNNCHTDIHLHSEQKQTWLFFPYFFKHPDESCVAQLTFHNSAASRMVLMDYEKLEAHSLFHCGLEGLGAYLVSNSEWKAQVGVDIECSKLNHYLFCFYSCLVEIIADHFEVFLPTND